VKRVYDQPDPDDGQRVLVDRLWPRGVGKADARLDSWLEDVAPSTELRRWYHEDSSRTGEFAERYRRELAAEPAASALAQLRTLATAGPVTLLTASKEVGRSHADVLAEELGGGR
jgi:uncharacterized protein YeaO (DUF488 family)